MARLTRLVALAVATLAVATTSPAAVARDTSSWASLEVPHLTVTESTPGGYPFPTAIQFGHNRLRYPRWGVTSMAATADAAIVLAQTAQAEFGRLLELPGQGRSGRVLERHPWGIPMGDPAGHLAFWLHQTAHGSRLVAYDTGTTTKQPGPRTDSGTRVFAVDGDTAYLVDFSGDVASWRPGDPDVTPLPALAGERLLLTDVQDGHALFTDFDSNGLVVTDLTGATLATLPRAQYATFSPNGSAFVAWTRRGYRAYDAVTLQELPLRGLHGREAYRARWSPRGSLVLSLVRSAPQALTHEAVIGFAACSLPDGRCHALPGRSNSVIEPFYESSPLGQLITLIGN
jgi:hypothetical protein